MHNILGKRKPFPFSSFSSFPRKVKEYPCRRSSKSHAKYDKDVKIISNMSDFKKIIIGYMTWWQRRFKVYCLSLHAQGVDLFVVNSFFDSLLLLTEIFLVSICFTSVDCFVCDFWSHPSNNRKLKNVKNNNSGKIRDDINAASLLYFQPFNLLASAGSKHLWTKLSNKTNIRIKSRMQNKAVSFLT